MGSTSQPPADPLLDRRKLSLHGFLILPSNNDPRLIKKWFNNDFQV